MLCRYTFLLLVFGFKRIALFSMGNRSSAEELVFPAKQLNHSGFDVPAFVMDLYRTYAKDDGPAERNPTRIPSTVHSIVGQATPRRNGIFFKLNGLNTSTNEIILSAKMRIMVKTIGPQPPFAQSNGNLVLYDQFKHTPLQSIAIEGVETRLVVFPLLSLVKRWLRFPSSNHGVYIRIHSNHQDDEKSLRIMLDSTGEEAKDDRPLLVVQTQSEPKKIYAGSFQTSHKQMADLKPKSRPSRAIHDRGPCSRRPLRVEISKNIRWQSVVVPKFFDAYRCGGDCTFPLDKRVNPSNYAIMQAILHTSRPDRGGGEPCCVPIKLKGINTIEYYDNDFRMHFYKEMVVEQCGCR